MLKDSQGFLVGKNKRRKVPQSYIYIYIHICILSILKYDEPTTCYLLLATYYYQPQAPLLAVFDIRVPQGWGFHLNSQSNIDILVYLYINECIYK